MAFRGWARIEESRVEITTLLGLSQPNLLQRCEDEIVG